MPDGPERFRGIPLLSIARRIRTLPADNGREIAAALLWCFIAAVIPLPALSQAGYPVWSMEYGIAAVATMVAGLIFYLVSKLKGVGPRLLVVLTAITVLLYFGAAMRELIYFCLITAGLLVFMAFAFSRPNAALRICGFAAFAQIAVTAIAISGAGTLLTAKDLPKKNVPSVIHLVLDEHAGMAAFPRDIVDEGDVKKLEEIYLSRGFTIFRRAYSADAGTADSIARLFNPGADTSSRLLEEDGSSHFLVQAEALERISQRRTLDLTFTDHVDLRRAAQNLENVVRLYRYRATGDVNVPEIAEMPGSDRLWIMAATLSAWFTERARSPVTTMLFTRTEAGRDWYGRLRPASEPGPLTARSLLRNLTERLECCGGRGSYMFAHLILPHYPYVFDKTCSVLPARAWLNAVTSPAGIYDTIETRKERWRRHYEQAYCTASEVAALADTVRSRKELADAVIIVHGDHGSRIAITDYAKRGIEGYDQTDHAKDGRGTFFAVRIPGVHEGEVVDTPVRIDDLFRHLVANDFRSLDLKTLKPRADSPYLGWRQDQHG